MAHNKGCLCFICESLPEVKERIAKLKLREMTVRGEMTGIQRHWMEESRKENLK